MGLAVEGARMAENGTRFGRVSGKPMRSDRPSKGSSRGAGRAAEGDAANNAAAENFRPLLSLDLFGDPVPPRRGAGRPRHAPTEATRAKVRELHRAGWKQPAIASALGITVPTLTLNYPAELESSSQAWRTRIELDRAKGKNGED